MNTKMFCSACQNLMSKIKKTILGKRLFQAKIRKLIDVRKHRPADKLWINCIRWAITILQVKSNEEACTPVYRNILKIRFRKKLIQFLAKSEKTVFKTDLARKFPTLSLCNNLWFSWTKTWQWNQKVCWIRWCHQIWSDWEFRQFCWNKTIAILYLSHRII